MKDGNKAAALMPYTEAIFVFLNDLSQDPTRDIEVLSKAVGLIG